MEDLVDLTSRQHGAPRKRQRLHSPSQHLENSDVLCLDSDEDEGRASQPDIDLASSQRDIDVASSRGATQHSIFTDKDKLGVVAAQHF